MNKADNKPDSSLMRAALHFAMEEQPRPQARIHRLVVRKSFGNPWSGRLQAGQVTIACALGQRGVRSAKREGDRATPRGRFRLLTILVRSRRPGALLPVRPIRRDDGWCDDPRAGPYNRTVKLPVRYGHEKLYRDDHVYDVVVILDHNRTPRIRGHGSAIFFHLARPGYAPTEGCVAIAAADMRRLLPRLARHVRMEIR